MKKNIITTKNLCKHFGEFIAVDNLNLEVDEGEIYALLGVNGAGKTTTIKMLSCLIQASNGDAELDGYSIITQPQNVKKIINVSPQETAIAENLSVKENIEFIAEIYGVDNYKEKVDDIIKKFNLENVKNKRAKLLSGGYQRRLSIAMAIVSEPKILFLDEPTLGLDVIARRELWTLIQELKNKMTIILTTHYMEEAEKLADTIGIMAFGKLIAVGSSKELIAKTKTKTFEDAFVILASGQQISENVKPKHKTPTKSKKKEQPTLQKVITKKTKKTTGSKSEVK